MEEKHYIVCSGKKREAVLHICKNWGKEFLLDKRRLSNKNRVSDNFYCSRVCSKEHEFVKRYKICAKPSCSKNFLADSKQQKYCSGKCATNHTTNRIRRELKDKLVKYKGGECEVCGYNKCVDALDFHHKNPSEKNFSLSESIHTKSWEELITEINKCSLLCANCHRGEHHLLNSMAHKTKKCLVA